MKGTVSKYYITSKRCIQEIDYSKKAKSDTLAKNDTLGPQFKTANGRIVYEGHGIQPDVKIEPELLSTITAHLYAQNMIFKYANKFYREHKSIAAPEEFVITDEIYDDFVKFVESQNFEYTSESEKDFEVLVKTAKLEGYYDNIKEQLDILENELKSHKDNDLINNKKEISEILKMELVGRYYFQKGKIVSTLKDDVELNRAVEILLNSNGKNEYETLLQLTINNAQ
jgi:carboxyl-terminal processing protease